MALIYEAKGDYKMAAVMADLTLRTRVETTEDSQGLKWPIFKPERIRILIADFRNKSAEALLSSLRVSPHAKDFAAGSALLELSGVVSGETSKSLTDMTLTVQYLLDKGADVNAQYGQGVTALIKSSFGGQIGMVQLLCDRGADVNRKGSKGDTALHAAAREGHVLIVKLLCEKSIHVDAKGEHEPRASSAEKPLDKAPIYPSLAGRVSTTITRPTTTKKEYLLTGGTAMIEAAYHGHTAVVECLLNPKANMELDNEHFGHTPLLAAAAKGHELTVKYLLNAGANIEVRDNAGLMTLRATQDGENVLIRLLMERGASIETRSGQAKTPLIIAASMYSNEEAVAILLDAGADIEAKDDDGSTALSEATSNNRRSVMKMLLSRGASAETTFENMPPLHIAAFHQNMEERVQLSFMRPRTAARVSLNSC